MRLQDLQAVPHPGGHRIDLTWVHPEPETYPGVRVVRREGTFPVSPTPDPGEGRVVADTTAARAPVTVTGAGRYRFEDTDGLRPETVYYYALFPYGGDPPVYDEDRHNRAAATATGRYGFAELMYRRLPGIYHRYDTVLPRRPEELAAGDRRHGQLRRFLDLPGSKLDQLYSFARALRHLYDLDRIDSRLLPLLAGWIGWETNLNLEPAAQRQEIRNAPALYQAIGLVPTIAATVRRIYGGSCQSKEFVHNVFLTNRPERLNLWLAYRAGGAQAGGFSPSEEPLSLNYAYEGRPAAARGSDGVLHLFFHTPRKGGWAIWTKSHSADGGWTPSRPVVDRGGIDKHPAAAFAGGVPWLFWNAWDGDTRRWRVEVRTLDGKGEPQPATGPFDDVAAERRGPVTAVDGEGFYLFWLERPLGTGGRFELRYSRHENGAWEEAQDLPFTDADPRVDDDVFAVSALDAVFVFWAHRRPSGWSLCYRVLGSDGWSAARELEPAVAGRNEREPAARLDGDGNLEVFYASDRDGGWSIWRNVLEVASADDLASHSWVPANTVAVTGPLGPPSDGKLYSQRTPLPVDEAGGVFLIYRSNRSLTYRSERLGGTKSVDFRYAGATTVDTRNVAKIALRGSYPDFQTYTFDTGVRPATGAGEEKRRSEDGWYANDTVGLYLKPSGTDPSMIVNERDRLRQVLRRFLPIQTRAVLILDPGRDDEYVYTDNLQIREWTSVTLRSTGRETLDGLRDAHTDHAPDWAWIRTWSTETPNSRTLDLTADPVDTSHRVWHVGIQPGE